MHTKNNIPFRKIEDDEDCLLNEIWSDLETEQSPALVTPLDFKKLQTRIQKKMRAKRQFRFAMVGSVAASLLVGLFICHLLFSVRQSTHVLAQFQEMGVTVASDQVILKIGNQIVMSLDSAARMEQKTNDSVSLQTRSGKMVALAPVQWLKLDVPVGRHFHLTLSDGTRVWLNADSSLEYPSSFDGKAERRVRLSGEAFFEVARNEQIPFYVETANQETIQVLGTSFNVNVYPESKLHFTTLVTGKISYQTGEGSSPIILKPNQQISFDCDAGKTAIRTVDASVYASWKDGVIYFEEEPLPALAQRLSRVYGVEIRVADRLKNYSFSGKISYDRGVDYITRLMAETNGIVCEVVEGVLCLK